MRKVRFVFMVLFILFFFSPTLSANDRDKFEETAGRGLEINTNPLGAKVYIDGVDHGLTPVFIDSLPPGKYRIELHKDNYEDRAITVILRAESLLIISVEMESARGQAQISVQKEAGSSENIPFKPELFTVTQDNSFAPVPLSDDNKALLTLTSNRHHAITARAFGWEDVTVTIFVSEQETAEETIEMKPAAFKISNLSQSRRRFNPMNPKILGSTEYRFEVTAHGSGVITITDSNGTEVFKKQFSQFDTWIQQITWDGRDSDGIPLPQGVYSVKAEAQDTSGENYLLSLKTEINYSINIFPLSVDSAVSGLTFAPMPHILPQGSYQFNAGVLAGSLGFPFKINMRISPVKNMELTALFNLNADKTHTGWGISGSVKYNFLDGGDIPLALSASLSYAWASDAGEHILSPGEGVGFHAPLSVELSDFSIVFCPSAFWRCPEGIIPELLLGAGVLYRGTWITGGLSARAEIDFKENSLRFLTGAEVHFIPPASNFVITAHGGIINKDGMDWYAGAGIGFIY